jgi:hypothetical protein
MDFLLFPDERVKVFLLLVPVDAACESLNQGGISIFASHPERQKMIV